MSYDILIFESDAITNRDFPQWWEQVSRREESCDYDTIKGSTPTIRAFCRDLIRAFPPFNGPDALSGAELEKREEQELPAAGCVIDADYIYIDVGQSDAGTLVKIIGQVAWMQRPAVAYVSEDSSIFRPQ